MPLHRRTDKRGSVAWPSSSSVALSLAERGGSILQLRRAGALSDARDGCLTVVGIAIGSGGIDEVGDFVRQRGLRYPMLIGNEQVAADYAVRTIPRSILLDSSGNEAAHWDGPIDRKAVRAALHALVPAPVHC